MKLEGLSRKHRIVEKKIITEIFSKGRYFSYSDVGVVAIRLSKRDLVAKYGFSVPKKFIRKAVHRNLIRRRMKEVVRRERKNIEPTLMDADYCLCLFFIWTSKKVASYENIKSDVTNVLEIVSSKLEKIPMVEI